MRDPHEPTYPAPEDDETQDCAEESIPTLYRYRTVLGMTAAELLAATFGEDAVPMTPEELDALRERREAA